MSKQSRLKLFQDHLEALPDDERQRVTATATGHVYLYVRAILQRAARLQASHSVTHTEHQADAILFVHALKGLYAVATVSVRLASGEAAVAMAEALQRFEERLPELVVARDALSHPDEYLAGFGKRQQGQGVSTSRGSPGQERPTRDGGTTRHRRRPSLRSVLGPRQHHPDGGLPALTVRRGRCGWNP